MGKFRTCNHFLYGFLDIAGINLVALFCTRSNFSTFIFLLGYHTLLSYYKCDLTKDLCCVRIQLLCACPLYVVTQSADDDSSSLQRADAYVIF